jgi:hypothetical protein
MLGFRVDFCPHVHLYPRRKASMRYDIFLFLTFNYALV